MTDYMRLHFKEGQRVREGTWCWICQYIAYSGGGLFWLAESKEGYGRVKTIDGLCDGLFRELPGEVIWLVRSRDLPGWEARGNGELKQAVVDCLSVMFAARAALLAETQGEYKRDKPRGKMEDRAAEYEKYQIPTTTWLRNMVRSMEE